MLVGAAPVVAQTPDGGAPKHETACDPLRADGVTKGLYGLCIAFCEAQAITSSEIAISEDELAAIEDSAPSGRVLNAYNKKKTENDPAMPCIKVEEPCPCWSAEDLENLMTGAADGFWRCQRPNDGLDPDTGEIDGVMMVDLDNDPAGPNPEGILHMAVARDQHRAVPHPTLGNREQCYYQEPPTGPSGGMNSPRFFSVAAGTLTHEQAAVCLAQVKASCDAAGKTY